MWYSIRDRRPVFFSCSLLHYVFAIDVDSYMNQFCTLINTVRYLSA